MQKRLLTLVNNISTKEELSDFVLILAQDFVDNKSDWENQDLFAFLEAVSAWIKDMDGFYTQQNKELPQNIPWKIFADILLAAKNYE